METKNFKVLATGKMRPVAFEFLKDNVTLCDQQKAKFTTEEFDNCLKEADALFSVGKSKIDDAFLDRAPNLKIIAQFSVGYDHIDVEACHRHNVMVTNTPGVLVDAVADLGYGLIINSARQLTNANDFVRNGIWGNNKAFGLTSSLAGKTLGIIGMGDIGCAVACRALASKMKIIYYNRHRRQDEGNFQASYTQLEDLLKVSDFLLLACSLNPSTMNLINAETLALMKPTACLINISRGKVVDTDALYEALVNKKLAYACLDVTEPEPLPGDHKLLTLNNVAVTPHMASATTETRDAMALLTAQNILAFAEGKPLLTEVK